MKIEIKNKKLLQMGKKKTDNEIRVEDTRAFPKKETQAAQQSVKQC